MERIAKIHTVAHSIQGKRDQPGILEHDVCEPTESPKRPAHAFGVKTIGAAQKHSVSSITVVLTKTSPPSMTALALFDCRG